MRVTKSTIMEYFREYALPALNAQEYHGINPDSVTYQITHSSIYGGYDLRKIAPGETGHRVVIERESARVFLEKLRAYVVRESRASKEQKMRVAINGAIRYLSSIDTEYTRNLVQELKDSLI